MNVLTVIHYPVFGGPHNERLRLNAPLAERGWRQIVLLPDEPGNGAERLRAGGVEVVQRPFGRLRKKPDPRVQVRSAAGFVPDVLRIRRLIHERDIGLVLVTGLVNPHAAIAGRLEGIPVVWQLLDTHSPMPLRRAMMPLVARLADSVMNCGVEVARVHPGAERLKDRMVLYYSPVDTRVFRPDPERRAAARAELGVPPDAPLIGTVGNLTAMKGHEYLLRAAARLRRSHPNLYVRILGAHTHTQADYERRLRAEAEALGLFEGDALRFVDPCARVPELMPAFDLFLQTSVPRSEGMPTVIVEAMACGLPVVAADIASVSEVVEDGVTGLLVPPLRPDRIAEAILRLLGDADLRARMGAEGRRRAVERYDVDICADAYARAFETAVGRRTNAERGTRNAERGTGRNTGRGRCRRGAAWMPGDGWTPVTRSALRVPRSALVGWVRRKAMSNADVPAILGGRPVRADFLSFARPLLTAEDEQEVLDCLRSGWVTYGPRAQRFEAEFADFVGARHAVGVNSATAALHLALVLAGAGPGDEVITTPITFPATANVIVHTGARPVFVDVELDTFNIDAEAVARAVTPRTRAIMPVHIAGHACDMDALRDIAARHRLTIIEDAAHAIETRYHGRPVGSLSPFTAFSFYATKNLWTVAGGMLTLDDDELAERARRLRLHGISSAAWSRYGDAGFTPYETFEPGYNYAITDLQAALALHQLPRLLDRWQHRRAIAETYDRAFAGNPYLALPRRAAGPGDRDAFHLYQVLLRTDRLSICRDEFVAALQKENIGAGVHFTPVHRHAYYRQLLGADTPALPVAEDVGARTLSLPLSASLTLDDAADVMAAVNKLTAWFGRACAVAG